MSLLASFLDTRTTRAAVAVAVALHGVVLFGLVQYGHAGRSPPVVQHSADAYQPITVVFVAETAPAAPSAPLPVQATAAPAARAQRAAPRLAVPPAQMAVPVQASPAVVADAAPATALLPAPATQAAAPDTTARDTKLPVAPPVQAGKPDYAYSPQPDYPMLLREQGVGGVVWLRVWVDSDGQPGEIKLAKGSGYRLLDDAAMRAVRQWRFVPARQGAQSLASWVEFPIRFTLNG